MKKNSVLLFITLVLFLISGCQKLENTKTDLSKSIKLGPEIVKMSGKCKISVSPKLELLGVVQYLADEPIIIKKGFDEKSSNYSKDIQAHFSNFKDEPVVHLYKKMQNNKFSYGRIPELVIRIDDELKFKEDDYDINEYLKKIGNNKETLLQFLQLLSDFYVKTNFYEFYNNHEEYYNNIASDVKNKVDEAKIVDRIVQYYGYEQKSYNIILYSLANGGFAERIPAENNKFNVYSFMAVPNNEIRFSRLLIHEFGHAYTGPLAYNQYAYELNKYSSLYNPIAEIMKKQNYHSWKNCVDEHVVRAVTNRILYEIYGNQVRLEDIESNKNNGFIYIDTLCQRLIEYEKYREKYLDFSNFYPELIKVFDEL